MLNLLFIFLIREKRGVFINRLTLPLRLFSSLINILFYYYAAKAFVPSKTVFSHSDQTSLFEFVMIGEIVLALHLDALIIYTQQLKQIIIEGTFDPLITTKKGILIPLIYMGHSSLLIGLITVFFNILILHFLFNINIDGILLLKAIILNLIFYPLFTALGLFSAGLLIILKRGSTFLGTFTGLLGILSGSYFPTTVFPHFIYQMNLILNPLHLLLSKTRSILANESTLGLQLPIFILTIGIVFIFVSIKFFNFSIYLYKKRGQVLILGT